MSQVFDFDGPLQTPAPGVFVMETDGGGEGEEPDPPQDTGDDSWIVIGRRRGRR